MQDITLNNGTRMPALGISTFMMTPDECRQTVADALAMGRRAIDTASAYGNEQAVGEALRKSEVSREDTFLVTKIWPRDYPTDDDAYLRCGKALDRALTNLGCDYIDQVLLHQPEGNYRSAWRALEDAVDAGKVRSIGLAYFSTKAIADVLSMARIKPQVVEAECQPYNQARSLRDLCQENGMQFVASMLLGGNDRALMDDNTFWELGAKYGVSNVDVMLRWLLQSGCAVMPKSPDARCLLRIGNVFGFELEKDEMARIDRLDRSMPAAA